MTSDPNSKPGFVVTVEFRLKTGAAEAFAKLIIENARRSLADEKGCRQFDVVVPAAEPDRVFLYEVYDDAEAFEAHKRTAHFLAFDQASAGLVIDRAIMLGTRAFH
ncbi:MAG: antibiotic biosynthesis monooxygenase [Methylobacteriaceae bacterium]|nr:antibiotic biosynthesis monooxygenase [Methylobacteriaceae bacterium]MBV9220441.1 antibiotic biosynthesis monooxygenase [Methylobacteriaceae bacterium]MBV9247359.1 antibiotic biosynthesis monooxygenase [Methylobacteriaceae bacterium]MBV9704922.1 antibiotic biosynthesis monooxygenase [Methylobacteriaceae bacterium]